MRDFSIVNARNKIVSIGSLEAKTRSLKGDGKVVVLCHGVFDLLHMGHIRHLEVARREGDVLIVTITSDRYVNKGPTRPVFNERLRAEAIAALEYVDLVAINDGPSAKPVIQKIKPDFFVKGGDYKAESDDITGNIVAEREATESNGGTVLFTKEIEFSSSTLINQHLGIYDPSVSQFLTQIRSEFKLEDFTNALNKIRDLKILFVGDTIIDEYQYVVPMGKSAKENMIATLFTDKEIFAGGVIAAANHVAGFCDNVEVLTALGSYDDHEQLIRTSMKPNIKLSPLYRNQAPTTRKCRFIDPGYSMRKLFEVYFMEDTPLSNSSEEELLRAIDKKIEDADLVIVTDFGHGLLTNNIIERLQQKSKFLAVNAQSNSANFGYNLITRYNGVNYVCVDNTEARLAVQEKHADIELIVSSILPQRLNCDKVIVTQGKRGCLVYDQGKPIYKLHALTKSIVDTVGAGDAFFALTAPLVAVGTPMKIVGFLGNAIGALKVGVVGHRSSIDQVELTKFITAILK